MTTWSRSLPSCCRTRTDSINPVGRAPAGARQTRAGQGTRCIRDDPAPPQCGRGPRPRQFSWPDSLPVPAWGRETARLPASIKLGCKRQSLSRFLRSPFRPSLHCSGQGFTGLSWPPCPSGNAAKKGRRRRLWSFRGTMSTDGYLSLCHPHIRMGLPKPVSRGSQHQEGVGRSPRVRGSGSAGLRSARVRADAFGPSDP